MMGIDYAARLLRRVYFIPNSNRLDISNLFESEINSLLRKGEFSERVQSLFFSEYHKFLTIENKDNILRLGWSFNPPLSKTISMHDSNSEVLLISSYNKGEEYEAKVLQVKRLRQEGISVCLGHLYKLNIAKNYDMPEKKNFEKRLYNRLKLWADETEIPIFAFHAGWMMLMRIEFYHEALIKFKSNYPSIKCIIEPQEWYKTNDKIEVQKFNADLNKIFDLESNLIDQIWNG